MIDIVQSTLDGLMVGSSYALLALGFTLIFGTMRRLNLAYGPTIMAGAYLGPQYSNDEIRAFLESVGARYRLTERALLPERVAAEHRHARSHLQCGHPQPPSR